MFGNYYYSYDNIGNRISSSTNGVTTTYSYERGNLLSSISRNNDNISYMYDYQNRRVMKNVNNLITNYYYHDNTLLGEDISNGIKIRYFYEEDNITGFLFINGNNQFVIDTFLNPVSWFFDIFKERFYGI